MYVERNIKEKFEIVASSYQIVTVVGPRQAGKTTFLKVESKKQEVDYLMFDDPDVLQLFNEDIKRFENQYLKDKPLGVLDEIQYGKDAGKKLKYLADSGHKIWITSSSQSVLGKEVLSWLVGRVSILRVFPFSFLEFLRSKGQKESTQETTQRFVWEHLLYGGYPKVALSDPVELKKTILKDLYETMVLKDVAKTFSIEDINSLQILSRYLANSIGHLVVYEKISTELGLSFQTVKKYLDAMEMSYLIVRVQPFSTNKLKEITKQPKLYFIDTGLRNAIANSFPVAPQSSGMLFENYIFSELLKLNLPIKYWQTKAGAEVDFIVEKDNRLIPIEVKIHSDVGRVEKSLRAFISAYRPKQAFVIIYEGEKGDCVIDGCIITFTDISGLIELLKA